MPACPPAQFLAHVIRPVLSSMEGAEPGIDSVPARFVLLGTGIIESGLNAYEQARGPALSVFQIEPATFDDAWHRFLGSKPELARAVRRFVFAGSKPIEQLAGNQHLACAIARLKYRMAKAPLPDPADADAMGDYWKRFYNSALGKGRPERFAAAYRKHVLPLL